MVIIVVNSACLILYVTIIGLSPPYLPPYLTLRLRYQISNEDINFMLDNRPHLVKLMERFISMLKKK